MWSTKRGVTFAPARREKHRTKKRNERAFRAAKSATPTRTDGGDVLCSIFDALAACLSLRSETALRGCCVGLLASSRRGVRSTALAFAALRSDFSSKLKWVQEAAWLGHYELVDVVIDREVQRNLSPVSLLASAIKGAAAAGFSDRVQSYCTRLPEQDERQTGYAGGFFSHKATFQRAATKGYCRGLQREHVLACARTRTHGARGEWLSGSWTKSVIFMFVTGEVELASVLIETLFSCHGSEAPRLFDAVAICRELAAAPQVDVAVVISFMDSLAQHQGIHNYVHTIAVSQKAAYRGAQERADLRAMKAIAQRARSQRKPLFHPISWLLPDCSQLSYVRPDVKFAILEEMLRCGWSTQEVKCGLRTLVDSTLFPDTSSRRFGAELDVAFELLCEAEVVEKQQPLRPESVADAFAAGAAAAGYGAFT